MSVDKSKLTYLLTDDGSIDQGENVDANDESNFIVTPDKRTPFDFINAINTSKVDLFEPDKDTGIRPTVPDSEYVKFIINKSFSYFADTIMYANLANIHLNNVPNSCHFDFYRLSIPRAKRFSKWGKKIVSDNTRALSEYYNVSIQKAEQIERVLTKDQIDKIIKILDHGGKQSR